MFDVTEPQWSTRRRVLKKYVNSFTLSIVFLNQQFGETCTSHSRWISKHCETELGYHKLGLDFATRSRLVFMITLGLLITSLMKSRSKVRSAKNSQLGTFIADERDRISEKRLECRDADHLTTAGYRGHQCSSKWGSLPSLSGCEIVTFRRKLVHVDLLMATRPVTCRLPSGIWVYGRPNDRSLIRISPAKLKHRFIYVFSTMCKERTLMFYFIKWDSVALPRKPMPMNLLGSLFFILFTAKFNLDVVERTFSSRVTDKIDFIFLLLTETNGNVWVVQGFEN